MDFSPENLRDRWQELTDQRVAIDVDLVPAWDELEAIVGGTAPLTLAEAIAREKVLRDQVRLLQDALYPIEQERASVARALGGRTG